jgi:F-type H+-transporting ATPase subunit b
MPSFLSLGPVLAAGSITDLNPGLTLWTAITFLVLLVVLGKFAWGPIVAMLAERERTIRDAIESAKKERLEAERLLSDQKQALAKARKEADELVATARQQIAEELSKARAELKAQVADLAIDAAGRLVKANLDDKAQRKLVEEYIAQLPANRAA